MFTFRDGVCNPGWRVTCADAGLIDRLARIDDPDEPLEGMERAKQNRILRKFAEQVSDALGKQG